VAGVSPAKIADKSKGNTARVGRKRKREGKGREEKQ